MTFAALTTSVRARFKAQVQDTYPGGLVVYWDNSPPVDESGDIVADPSGFHVRAHVLPVRNDIIGRSSPGNRVWRRSAILSVLAFTPVDEGDSPLWTFVDTIETAFGGVRADGVLYRRVEPKQPFLDPGTSAFWMMPIDVAYQCEETR